MSGERKTDATFWTPATRSLDPSGKALRWEMMRGASRLAWRMGGVYLLLLLTVLPISYLLGRAFSLPWYLSFSVIAWSNVSVIGGALLFWSGRRIVREHGGIRLEIGRNAEEKIHLSFRRTEGRRAWRQEKVLPIARSASVILGCSIPERAAEKWVHVPKNYRDGGWVVLQLPATFTGADQNIKTRMTRSVSAKLGVPGMEGNWQTEGSSPRVLFSAPPAPPESVEYSDIKEWILHSEEYRPFLGLAGGSSPFYAEMIDDSPHVGLSAGPGAGKSTMAKAVIAQALRWGWGVVVLDWKQSGAFDWLGGLEGVTYLSRIDQIHEMGERIAAEVDDRKENGMGQKAKVLVVRDEWNVTAPLLKDYWDRLRALAEPEDKKLMPLRSPALQGYAILDFAGREYGLFDFCVAQKFSARIFNGNADIRECFNIKLLARYSKSTVNMLAPDVKPFPRKNNMVGRWVAVVGDEATVLQAPFLTSAEAREVATGGVPNPKFPFGRVATSQLVEDREYLGNPLRHVATPSQTASSVVNSSPRGVKLSDLAETWGVGLPGLRKIVEREDFPSPIAGDQFKGYRYDRAAVTEWWNKRAARMAAEGAGK